MLTTTRQLLHIPNTGHPGMNSLFSKAHSMGWDLDRDVDWSQSIPPDEPCVDPSWALFGRTPTFQALPQEVRTAVTRMALGRMLNVLQVGESVAQNVCAKLALVCDHEDHRNHAVAQAMDEARHHLAYVRFLDKMGETPEGIDPFTEGLFDDLLASDDVTEMVATEQFFLESLAMPIFDSLVEKATHPLLREIAYLIRRDESRHVAFGVLYVTDLLRRADPEEKLAFARRWLPRIIGFLEDRPGPVMRARMASRLARAGVADAVGLAARMLEEEQTLEDDRQQAMTSGRKVPTLLASCRKAGLLEREILEALDLEGHPLIRGTVGSAEAL
jgi:hypothetical protein